MCNILSKYNGRYRYFILTANHENGLFFAVLIVSIKLCHHSAFYVGKRLPKNLLFHYLYFQYKRVMVWVDSSTLAESQIT